MGGNLACIFVLRIGLLFYSRLVILLDILLFVVNYWANMRMHMCGFLFKT